MRNYHRYLQSHVERLESEHSCEDETCRRDTDESLCLTCAVRLICYELNSYLKDGECTLNPSDLLKVFNIPDENTREFQTGLRDFIKGYSAKVGNNIDLQFAQYADLLLESHDSRIRSGFDLWWAYGFQTSKYFHVDLDDRPDDETYYTYPIPIPDIRSACFDDPIRPVYRFVSHGLLTTYVDVVLNVAHLNTVMTNSSESHSFSSSFSSTSSESSTSSDTSSGTSSGEESGYYSESD